MKCSTRELLDLIDDLYEDESVTYTGRRMLKRFINNNSAQDESPSVQHNEVEEEVCDHDYYGINQLFSKCRNCGNIIKDG